MLFSLKGVEFFVCLFVLSWVFQIYLTEGSIVMHFLAFIFLCKSFIPPNDGDDIKAQGAESCVDRQFSDWQVKLGCDLCYGCSALVLPLVIDSGPHSRVWSLLFRPELHGVLKECCRSSERVLPLG